MQSGLFGKLPSHGDFISRGLGASRRKALDHWVTRNIGQQELPAGGLCARFNLDGTPIVAVILQSRDKHGRIFPLVVVTDDNGQGQTEFEDWCNTVADVLAQAIENRADADVLAQDLPAAPSGAEDDQHHADDIMWQLGEAPQPLARMLAALSSD